MATYQDIRTRHIAELRALLPEYVARLDWPAARLQQERERGLRELLRVARERSPWHRRRLASVDPATVTEADLARIPPMTKADLMAHWDRIVTEPRLTLAGVNAYLETLTTDQYLFDEYHCVATGGSSGLRGVFVYDRSAWTRYGIMLARWGFRNRGVGPQPSGPAEISAHVCAGHATHLSSAIQQTFTDPGMPIHRFPITLPVAQIVAGLNELQPQELGGYPSAVYLLTHEARAGRLKISPRRVGTYAEPLLPEIRAAVEEIWGVTVNNLWGCSEGAVAVGEGCRGMHLADDLAIVEPVDAAGKPVPPGVRSAKIYLTNLYNQVLPLLRYELTDELTVLEEACPCGSAHRRIDDVQGRQDHTFTYAGTIRVHPLLFHAALGKQRNILEYQVRQTLRGAEIAIRSAGEVDVAGLRSGIAQGLQALGLDNPQVAILPVDHFPRLVSGKLKRFLPLESSRT